MKHLIPLVVGALVLCVVWVLDVPRDLGAHPWWSQRVVLVGGGAGLVLGALTFWVPGLVRMLAFLVLAGAAYGVAKYGAAEFAASFAEDRFAGRLWFFGWHGTLAFVAALVVAITSYAMARRNP